MASESSSAVLDMTDECDSHQVCDNDLTPVIMEHGYDIGVKVDAPIKQLSRLETFVTYRVRCSCARWPAPPFVRRRYNHFKVLHKRLAARHPLLPIPPLPALHSARQQLDRYSAHFVASRAVALEAMLARIAKHPILTHSEDFKLFVTTPDEQIDAALRTDPSPLALWSLGSVLGQENNGVRVKDPEFSSAYDYLHSLQQKLTTLCSLTNTLYKSHHSLTKEYTGLVPDGWPASESSAVQRAASALQLAATRRAAVREAPRPRAPAVLPLLASYCHAVQHKIRQRDALHCAHVAGAASPDAVHNRLEQASEALRSELADWNGKTKAELKQMLLDLAEGEVSVHRQSVAAWESGLQAAAHQPPQLLFQTVSKQCVRNLSPCKPDSPADTDLDDLSLNSEDNFVQIPAQRDCAEQFQITSDDNSIEEIATNGTSQIGNALISGRNISTSSLQDIAADATSDYFMADNRNTFSGHVQEITSSDNVPSSIDDNINAAVASDNISEENSKHVESDPLSQFCEVDLSDK